MKTLHSEVTYHSQQTNNKSWDLNNKIGFCHCLPVQPIWAHLHLCFLETQPTFIRKQHVILFIWKDDRCCHFSDSLIHSAFWVSWKDTLVLTSPNVLFFPMFWAISRNEMMFKFSRQFTSSANIGSALYVTRLNVWLWLSEWWMGMWRIWLSCGPPEFASHQSNS